MAEEEANVATRNIEQQATGRIGFGVYWEFVRHMAPCISTVVLIFVLFVSGQAILNVSDWWLNKWHVDTLFINSFSQCRTTAAENAQRNASSDFNTTLSSFDPLSQSDYMYIYIGLCLLLLVVSIARALIFRISEVEKKC